MSAEAKLELDKIVDILFKLRTDWFYFESYSKDIITRYVRQQAKELEEKQRDEFAIGFAEWCLKIRFEPIKNISVEKLLEIYKKEKGL